MTIQAIAHAFRHHYQELGYVVDRSMAVHDLHDTINFFAYYPQLEWIASLYFYPDGITHDARNRSLNDPSQLYDYADPRLIDQLDQLIADSYNGIPK